jgi:hypothetical protein
MKSNKVLPERRVGCTDMSGAVIEGNGVAQGRVRISLVGRVRTAALLICSLIVLSGTKACQEDYDLGSQTTLVGTATPTPTVSATETDDGIKTATPTTSVTPTPIITANLSPTPVSTPTLTPTPTSEVAAAVSGTSASSVRSLLGEVGSTQEQEDVKARIGNIGGGSDSKDRNWLGKAFVDDGEAAGSWVDSDDDGFSDELEARLSQQGAELILPESRLADRVEVYDQDLDGFEDKKEIEQGLSPNSSDTDLDGFLDGLEVLAGSSPVDKRSRPKDDDRDGAPDVLEESLGLNVSVADTDGDRLPDKMEIVLSSDGAEADTDGDGISDGKEVDLGSDPLISDFPES